LVYAEWHDDIRTAIQRETSIKRWPRAWKLDLITEQNPQWEDRYAQLT
jgi:putative endonuclease